MHPRPGFPQPLRVRVRPALGAVGQPEVTTVVPVVGGDGQAEVGLQVADLVGLERKFVFFNRMLKSSSKYAYFLLYSSDIDRPPSIKHPDRTFLQRIFRL